MALYQQRRFEFFNIQTIFNQSNITIATVNRIATHRQYNVIVEPFAIGA